MKSPFASGAVERRSIFQNVIQLLIEIHEKQLIGRIAGACKRECCLYCEIGALCAHASAVVYDTSPIGRRNVFDTEQSNFLSLGLGDAKVGRFQSACLPKCRAAARIGEECKSGNHFLLFLFD